MLYLAKMPKEVPGGNGGGSRFIGKHPDDGAKIGAKHTGFAEGMIKGTIEEMPECFFKIGVVPFAEGEFGA